MQWIHTIFANMISTSVIVAAASWFLKKYLDKRIEYIFQEKTKVVESKLKIAERYEEHLFQVLVDILPEIQERVYRCRNLLKDSFNKHEPELLDKANESWVHLSEGLFKYQLYFPETTFKNLHKFKRLFHGTAFLLSANLDMVKNSIEETSAANNQTYIEQKKLINDNISEMDGLYKIITRNFKELMDKKVSLLN